MHSIGSIVTVHQLGYYFSRGRYARHSEDLDLALVYHDSQESQRYRTVLRLIRKLKQVFQRPTCPLPGVHRWDCNLRLVCYVLRESEEDAGTKFLSLIWEHVRPQGIRFSEGLERGDLTTRGAENVLVRKRYSVAMCLVTI